MQQLDLHQETGLGEIPVIPGTALAGLTGTDSNST